MKQIMQPTDKKKMIKRLGAVTVFLVSFAGLFYTALNWGEKQPAPNTGKKDDKSAFNTTLPAPQLSLSEKNKLELYMEAQRDSIKLAEARANDPFEKRFFNPGPPVEEETDATSSNAITTNRSHRYVDANERKVNERLEKLYKELNSASTTTTQQSEPLAIPGSSGEAERLEQLLESVHQSYAAPDPELRQADTLLEKLLDLQYPERIRNRKLTNAPMGATVQVSKTALDTLAIGFYGITASAGQQARAGEAIQAVIHETQTIHNGSTVRLRLLQDIFLAGQRIPKDQFIHGIATIQNERVHLQLSSLSCNNNVYAVELTVYDKVDGLQGLYVPGAESREIAGNGVAQAVQGMELFSLDPSVGAQAASAGVQTAKNLLTRKVKNISVTLKAGHAALLKNNDQVN